MMIVLVGLLIDTQVSETLGDLTRIVIPYSLDWVTDCGQR